ncbi:hypothetical protein FOXB_10865, partial [Fusarium oxysporum f. sp. conglutinans Fo5176]
MHAAPLSRIFTLTGHIITHYIPALKAPEGTPRFDNNCRRVLTFGKHALQCGRILQDIHDSKRSQRTNLQDCGLIYQECIKSLSHRPDKSEGCPSLGASACLAASCIFAHRTEMQMLDPSEQSLGPNQEYLFQDYRNFARRSVEKYFKINEDEEEEYEEDDDEFLSLPKAICLLHDFLLVTRTPRSPAETTTSDQIAALIPKMRDNSELANC